MASGDDKRFQTSKVLTLAGVHFVHDIFTAFLAPLLPLLIKSLSLSLTQAGSLTVVQRILSLFNPFIGTLVDKLQKAKLLVILSPAVTGVVMCTIGLAPSYTVLLLLLLVSGISVATLHVSTPVMVAEVSGDAMGRGMSFFQVGGELARTLGPLVAVWAVSSFGLEGLWQMAPVAVASSAVIWWRVRRFPVPAKPRRRPSLLRMVKEMRRIFVAVVGIMVARAFLVAGTTTFLPTYLVDQGSSLWFAGIAFSIFELAGAAGVLTMGWWSDRLGRRRSLLAVSLAAPPLLVLFVFAEGWLVVPALLALGFVTISSLPVMLALVLEHAGENRAAANGTFMAISFAVRALVILVVGLMGDAWGLRTTFLVSGGLAAVGIPFVLVLPREQTRG